MSEPTAPVCPRCGTPRAADGTPACSCGRLASDAHRDTRTAQAQAAEDFDPLRIRPFVKVGDDADPVDSPKDAEVAPRQGPLDGDEAPEASADREVPEASADRDALENPADADADADADAQATPTDGDVPTIPVESHGGASALTGPDGQSPAGRAPDGPRRRRRAVLVAGAGVAAVVVLVTGGIIGGLFSYESPTRDGAGPEDVRADLPEAASGAGTSSPSATPSRAASSASPSGSPSTSPAGTPSGSQATPTGSDTPTRTPSNSDSAAAAAAPAPTLSDGQDPVLGLGLGDSGPEVTELQLRLRQIGLYSGDTDGDYDREVESAVRGYQLTRAVLEDESGVYGPVTRASLESETEEP